MPSTRTVDVHVARLRSEANPRRRSTSSPAPSRYKFVGQSHPAENEVADGARRSGIVEPMPDGRTLIARTICRLPNGGEMHLHGHADEGHQGGGRQRGGPARDSRIVGEGEVDPASRRLDGQLTRVGVEALELADEGGLGGAEVRPDGAKQERDDHQTRRSGEQQDQAANWETDNAAHPAHPFTRRVPDPFEAGKIEAALDSPENTAASAPVPPDLLGQNDPAVVLSVRTRACRCAPGWPCSSPSWSARSSVWVCSSLFSSSRVWPPARSGPRRSTPPRPWPTSSSCEPRRQRQTRSAASWDLYADLPMVRDVTVVALGPDPWSVTTATALRPDCENLALRAAQARSLVWGERSPQVTLAAVPIVRDGRVFGGVAVAVGLDVSGDPPQRPAARLLVRRRLDYPAHAPRRRARAASGPPSNHVDAGDDAARRRGGIAARSAIARDDELGAVARGLNDMLARLERVHLTQSQRIAEATQALDARNQEIVTSYQRMFALREALARAQQTAAAGKTAANLADRIGIPSI